MMTKLGQCLAPPVFEDEEKTRIARPLNNVLLSIVVASVGMLVWVLVCYGMPADFAAWFTVLSAAAISVMSTGLLFLLRRGHVKIVGALLLAVIWTVVTAWIYRADGIRSTAVTGYFLAVAIAGSVFGGWGAIVIGLACILAAVGALFGESRGLIASYTDGPPHPVSFVVFVMSMGTVALLLRFAARSTAEAFERARHTARVLAESNHRLETEVDERMQAEAALQEREERFRALVQNAVDLITVVDAEGTFVYASPSHEWVLGYAPEELLGADLATLVHPDDLLRVMETYAEIVRNPSAAPPLIEFRVRHRDGSWHWVEATSSNQLDNPAIGGIVGNARDITDRKRAQETLGLQNAALMSAANAIVITDCEGEITWVNPAFAHLTGYAVEEAIGRNPRVLKSGSHDTAFYREMWETILAGDVWHGELVNKRKDGSLYTEEMTITPVRGGQGEIGHYIAIKQDVSERVRIERELERHRLHLEELVEARTAELEAANEYLLREIVEHQRAEIALQESHENIQALLSAPTDAMFIVDPAGIVLAANEIMSQNLGRAVEEMLGRPLYDFIPPEVGRSRRMRIEEAVRTRTPVRFQDRCGEMYFSNTVYPVADGKGDVVRLVVIARNITERVQAEEELRRHHDHLEDLVRARTAALEAANRRLREARDVAESADRAKSAFLTSVSHELRTPLNAILGFSELMARDADVTTTQREYLGTILSSGEHLLSLINSVLEISKIEAGRVTLDERSFDLRRLLDEVASMFGWQLQAKGLAFLFQVGDQVPRYAHADNVKLRQILINLLSNALKFTDQGQIVLRVTCQAGEPVHILHCEVEDTGAGIAPEELDSLFQIFAQTSAGLHIQKGTGLGLALSARFAELMGGRLEVQSEVGQGSTFSLDVPVRQAEGSAGDLCQANCRVVGLAPGQPACRVLVVDDEWSNRRLLVEWLSLLGFEIQEADDGWEALDAWRTWRPHLILMDMRMPVMDGYEVTRRIRSQTTDRESLTADRESPIVPVIIAVTASVFEEQRAAILASGCDDLIRKPFREAEVLAKIAERLGVCYLYEKEALPQGRDAGIAIQAPLKAEDLAVLPADLVATLHQAVLRGRGQEIRGLLARIDPEHALLAARLTELVHVFDFDRLVTLTTPQA